MTVIDAFTVNLHFDIIRTECMFLGNVIVDKLIVTNLRDSFVLPVFLLSRGRNLSNCIFIVLQTSYMKKKSLKQHLKKSFLRRSLTYLIKQSMGTGPYLAC